jgi:hypothetical protein
VKSGAVEAIRAAGGEIYGITSEPQALATRAQADWELPFECVGDPHQEIADTARERGWLDLRVGEVGDFLTRDTAWEVSHPKGFFQPGVIALTPEQRLLYRWQSVPTRQNAGGATGRPSAEHVWEQIQQALAEKSDSHAALDETPPLDSKPPPFALFSLMLMAHGWFLRPKAFTYQGNGEDPMKRFPMVMLRLIVFIVLWISAFALLPTLWVCIALVLYLPIAIRGVRSVYTTFQVEAT